MSEHQLNPYERLQQPIALPTSALRHRAALMTISTPVILMWVFDLVPANMPLMSLAVAKSSAETFWKLMGALISWAFLTYVLDLLFAFADRKRLSAIVQQGIAYEIDTWFDPFDAEEREDEQQRPPDDQEAYDKWGQVAEDWRLGIAKAEHYMLWITRFWMPGAFGLFAISYCIYSAWVC